MATDPTPSDFGQHVFEVFMALYVYPEIHKRQKDGTLETPATIWIAQIFFLPGESLKVRLNREASGIASVQLKSDVTKASGEPVMFAEIESIENFQPPDPDTPHVTFSLFEGVWTIAFAFAFNKQAAADRFNAAEQFLQCADDALSRDHIRAACYNLFCAAELLAQTSFLILPDAHLVPNNHGPIKNNYNLFRRDNLPLGSYTDTLNRLYDLRKPSRYFTGAFSVTQDELSTLLETIRNMKEEIGQRLGL